MMEEKIYTCECGKTFSTPNSFNGHKSNCKIHYKAVGKDIDVVREKRAVSIKSVLNDKYQHINEEIQLKWIDEKHTCEKCGKVMTEKFGSGRFCSQSCSNSHQMTTAWRTNLSNAVTGNSLTVEEFEKTRINPDELQIECEICHRRFKNKAAITTHIVSCKQKHNIPVFVKIGEDELDITKSELKSYMENQTTCEICGRSVYEVTKYTGKTAVKNLCVDHDHETNKFRGLLCQVCNRQLGWYEKNRIQIESYLDKHKN